MSKSQLAEHPVEANEGPGPIDRHVEIAIPRTSQPSPVLPKGEAKDADAQQHGHNRPLPEPGAAEHSAAPRAASRDTLLDFFDDVFTSPAEFLVHDTGYRSWTYSYEQVRRAATGFAARLQENGIGKGDKVIICGENRAEWVVALWGCLLQGVIVVPIDYRASADLVHRVREIVQARSIVIGDEVKLESNSGTPIWRLGDINWNPSQISRERPQIRPEDTAEIIFTSGATADPKGVVITHKNILANIVPIEREVAKYRRYARPFFPIRFLNLLPLSHMFGQAMATFVPPMLPGAVVFMRGYNPTEITRQIKTRRITLLVGVPKMLDVLRGHVLQQVPEAHEATEAAASTRHVLARIWRYRRVHRLLGWKFWAFVVGAAPLERDLEDFWLRLGFAVVQGYGLTETAPIVTLVHPFKPAAGTVGEPIAGVDVKIAPDGEILVRGPNVTPGYYHAESETAEAFEGGWFHTGDIGEMDESGRLMVRGRKKEMIATPEGMKVFPNDVERVLNELPGVHESAVVGLTHDGQERVHAVRTALAHATRRASLSLSILPLTRLFAWIHVEGLEHLQSVQGPVIFAANHQSHMDTPVIMAALPRPWRHRVSPAMAKEFFEPHFHPEGHGTRQVLTNRLGYYLAALFFNAFPLPQREAGARETLRYIGELVSHGISILIFPEGERTERGEINRFQPGVGMMASRLNVPVVPVRLEGLDRVLHKSWRMARPGRVSVKFGEPLALNGQDYVALAKRVEDAVKSL